MEKLLPCHIFCHKSFLHTKINGKGYYDKMYLLNRLRIYVGCSQNHPYCGEWLPNQVFRGGACGLYVVRGTQTVYSNVKLTAERDADTGGLVWKTEVRHRSQAGCWTNTIISTIPIRHEPQYWGRAAVRFIITVNELTVPGLSVRSETYTISDNKTCISWSLSARDVILSSNSCTHSGSFHSTS